MNLLKDVFNSLFLELGGDNNVSIFLHRLGHGEFVPNLRQKYLCIETPAWATCLVLDNFARLSLYSIVFSGTSH